MSKIALEGNALGSGTLTIKAPNTNTNTNRNITLPDETGTLANLTGITVSSNQYITRFTGTATGTATVSSISADVEL